MIYSFNYGGFLEESSMHASGQQLKMQKWVFGIYKQKKGGGGRVVASRRKNAEKVILTIYQDEQLQDPNAAVQSVITYICYLYFCLGECERKGKKSHFAWCLVKAEKLTPPHTSELQRAVGRESVFLFFLLQL